MAPAGATNPNKGDRFAKPLSVSRKSVLLSMSTGALKNSWMSSVNELRYVF